jgi:hypothetical protein
MIYKNRKKVENFMFEALDVLSSGLKGLDVLHGGL